MRNLIAALCLAGLLACGGEGPTEPPPAPEPAPAPLTVDVTVRYANAGSGCDVDWHASASDGGTVIDYRIGFDSDESPSGYAESGSFQDSTHVDMGELHAGEGTYIHWELVADGLNETDRESVPDIC